MMLFLQKGLRRKLYRHCERGGRLMTNAFFLSQLSQPIGALVLSIVFPTFFAAAIDSPGPSQARFSSLLATTLRAALVPAVTSRTDMKNLVTVVTSPLKSWILWIHAAAKPDCAGQGQTRQVSLPLQSRVALAAHAPAELEPRTPAPLQPKTSAFRTSLI